MTIDTTDQEKTDVSEIPPPADREEARPAPIGDGYDAEPLLTAEDVGILLQVPTKSVYELPIPKVRISKRRIRYRPEDVEEFIDKRASKS